MAASAGVSARPSAIQPSRPDRPSLATRLVPSWTGKTNPASRPARAGREAGHRCVTTGLTPVQVSPWPPNGGGVGSQPLLCGKVLNHALPTDPGQRAARTAVGKSIAYGG